MSLPAKLEELRARYVAGPCADVVERLVGHVEERLRVNVGLIAENEALRRRLDELERGR